MFMDICMYVYMYKEPRSLAQLVEQCTWIIINTLVPQFDSYGSNKYMYKDLVQYIHLEGGFCLRVFWEGMSLRCMEA